MRSPGRWCWSESTPAGGCVSIPTTWGGSARGTEAPALEHAYAATTYQAQGATVDSRLRDGRSLDGPSRSSTSPPRAAARRPTSTRRRRSSSSARSIAPRSPVPARRPRAHRRSRRARSAPRPPPTTRRCAPSSRSCRPLSWSPACGSCAPRPGPSATTKPDTSGPMPTSSDTASIWSTTAPPPIPSIHPTKSAPRSRSRRCRPSARSWPRSATKPGRRRRLPSMCCPSGRGWRRLRLGSRRPTTSPPSLGERPADPKKAAAWDRGVSEIESYRTRNGVEDRDNALGPTPHERHAQHEQRQARQALERTQRQLQLQRQRQRSVERSVDLGMGR